MVAADLTRLSLDGLDGSRTLRVSVSDIVTPLRRGLISLNSVNIPRIIPGTISDMPLRTFLGSLILDESTPPQRCQGICKSLCGDLRSESHQLSKNLTSRNSRMTFDDLEHAFRPKL